MKQYSFTRTEAKGFTLIELLVVIAIIGVLAAVVLLAINPAELLRKSRDSTRLSDLSSIRKALDGTVAQGTLDLATAVNGVDCKTADVCISTARNRSTAGNGAGWLPYNLSTYLSTLPVDPINGSGSGVVTSGTSPNFVYTLTTGQTMRYEYMVATDSTYELRTLLESTSNGGRLTTDGGEDNSYFETGTDPGLDLM